MQIQRNGVYSYSSNFTPKSSLHSPHFLPTPTLVNPISLYLLRKFLFTKLRSSLLLLLFFFFFWGFEKNSTSSVGWLRRAVCHFLFLLFRVNLRLLPNIFWASGSDMWAPQDYHFPGLGYRASNTILRFLHQIICFKLLTNPLNLYQIFILTRKLLLVTSNVSRTVIIKYGGLEWKSYSIILQKK